MTQSPTVENVVAELREYLPKLAPSSLTKALDVQRGLLLLALIESQRATIERIEREAADKDEQIKQLNAMCRAAELKGEPDRSTARDRMRAAEARVTALEAEKAGLGDALEWLAGEIEGERNLITHPHGRRAHHIDSQDEIRVEVLTGLLDRARQALSRSSMEVNDGTV